jgi:hypothetical protein
VQRSRFGIRRVEEPCAWSTPSAAARPGYAGPPLDGGASSRATSHSKRSRCRCPTVPRPIRPSHGRTSYSGAATARVAFTLRHRPSLSPAYRRAFSVEVAPQPSTHRAGRERPHDSAHLFAPPARHPYVKTTGFGGRQRIKHDDLQASGDQRLVAQPRGIRLYERRGWDSNPRVTLTATAGFQDRRKARDPCRLVARSADPCEPLAGSSVNRKLVRGSRSVSQSHSGTVRKRTATTPVTTTRRALRVLNGVPVALFVWRDSRRR